MPFSRLSTLLGQFFEALVEAQIVSNGIFPSIVFAVEERVSATKENEAIFTDGSGKYFLTILLTLIEDICKSR